MKYLILALLVLFSCTIQLTEKVIEEETIIETMGGITTAINQKIFPIISEPSSSISFDGISKSIIGDTDFTTGTMYVDNAYQTDGKLHTLDISSIVGKQQVLLALKFTHISGCDNEYGRYRIKPYGMNVTYTLATCYLNVQESIIFVLTDTEGRLQWYSEYSWPYDKRVSMEITALWYSQGITIIETNSDER